MSTTRSVTVTGMTCVHCVAAVRSEIVGLDGVEQVDVDLDSGRVTITSSTDIADDALAAAVDEAGYAVSYTHLTLPTIYSV